MKKYIYFIGLIVICIAFSCSTSSKLQKGTDIAIQHAYLQKEIPGQEHMQIKDYLHIHFKTNVIEECKLDSVYYLNKVYKLIVNNLKYSIHLDKGRTASDTLFVNSRKEAATLFYHKQETPFYLIIENIKRKEDLYLP